MWEPATGARVTTEKQARVSTVARALVISPLLFLQRLETVLRLTKTFHGFSFAIITVTLDKLRVLKKDLEPIKALTESEYG